MSMLVIIKDSVLASAEGFTFLKMEGENGIKKFPRIAQKQMKT